MLTSYKLYDSSGYLGAEFIVPPPGKAAYLGTLEMKIRQERGIGSYLWRYGAPTTVGVNITVEDARDISAQQACGLSATEAEPTVSMMEIRRR
jgi:hypothetical protein